MVFKDGRHLGSAGSLMAQSSFLVPGDTTTLRTGVIDFGVWMDEIMRDRSRGVSSRSN